MNKRLAEQTVNHSLAGTDREQTLASLANIYQGGRLRVEKVGKTCQCLD